MKETGWIPYDVAQAWRRRFRFTLLILVGMAGVIVYLLSRL